MREERMAGWKKKVWSGEEKCGYCCFVLRSFGRESGEKKSEKVGTWGNRKGECA